MPDNGNNPVTSALEKVYNPLVQLSSQLPAPLAYGLAILVALIVAFIVTVLFGAAIPTSLLWFIFAIDVTALIAFIFVDWDKRRQSVNTRSSSISHILESSIFYVVVHEGEDQTNVIDDAEVTLALPEPVIKKTGSNGAANFTISNNYIGQEFSLNARKANYKTRNAHKVVLRRQGHEFISLEPARSEENQPTPSGSMVAEHRVETNKMSDSFVYDSNKEEESFISWTLFSTAGVRDHISIIEREIDNRSAFKLSASSTELVGVNKSFRVLHGRVEFEYKVEHSGANGPNIFFYMIPMQETGIGRTGLIEVGTNVQDDPRNAFSPYRFKFLVPTKHFGDGKWHKGAIDFDFRDTPEAFYSIFGPRINEGAMHPGAGVLLITNVKLFSKGG